MAALVLTFAGKDRPGLVSLIADTIAASGGNWLQSRLAHLAGEFAGIVLIDVAGPQRHGLTVALQELQEKGLSVTLTPAGTALPADRTTLTLEVVGHDRPGIVRDVTKILTGFGVNIEEFSSRLESAPFTGEDMFHATLGLSVPPHVGTAELRRALEALADEVMVDVRVPEEAAS
jgi:glycine cleavage system regulatory protein